VSVLDAAKAMAWRDMYSDLRQMLDWNAQLGYVIDPAYPAPEVFERPGWTDLVAEPGFRELRFAVAPGIREILDENLLDAPIQTSTDVVRPLVEREVTVHTEGPPRRLWLGIGLYVPLRHVVLFHSGG
jgi:hypothetical protein